MTTAELMAELKKANINLAVIENDLVIRGKKQLLNAELLTQIREHKPALLDLLQAGEKADAEGSNRTAHSPEVLPLVELTAAEIEEVAKAVPGGAANVQDIYPLAPLQEGILFHYLLDGGGDAYLMRFLSSFDTRARVDKYVTALQAVVDRNDILRTAVLWEGLPEPMQVVWRKAPLQIEEIELDSAAGDAAEQMYARFDPRRLRIDVRQAPLLRLHIAYDQAKNRWLMLMLLHHLVGDHTTLEVMEAEIQAYLLGQEERLPKPLPFRNLVAQARHGISQQEHEAFFRQMLGDVDEPTTPFGLLDVLGDGTGIEEASLVLGDDLALRLRANARRLGITAASLFHVAWAQVLAEASGRANVVFGTVLFGRMQSGEGAERVLGLFINTLPIRITVDKEGVAASARRTHALLAELMRHEHASLALAQRCSAVPTQAPLFSSLLNYRYDSARTPSEETLQAWEGIARLRGDERTNYPLVLSVNDRGRGFSLDAQTPAAIGPMRVCEFMRTALESLVDALESAPATAVRALEVLPASERHQLLYEWNDTKADYQSDKCVHEVFEDLAVRAPNSTAVVFENESFSYAELNRRANQLAHYLRELGVKPDATVAICMERSFGLIVAFLAVLKAGGAYLPLEPDYPVERLRFMVEDSQPVALLTQSKFVGLFAKIDHGLPVLQLDDPDSQWKSQPEKNPSSEEAGLTPLHLAYIIYTSGSTGQPKGVMVPHRAINRLVLNNGYAMIRPGDRVAFAANPAFDATTLEVWAPLLNGGCVVVIDKAVLLEPVRFCEALRLQRVSLLWLTVGLFNQYADILASDLANLRYLIVGGDALSPSVMARVLQNGAPQHLLNGYGPTETTTFATTYEITAVPEDARTIPIGHPIANTQTYILNALGQPVPIGVPGELYIGGAGVARGYLNRPELTAERFLSDPFSDEPGARMYRTGDLARWLPDGNIEFLGRNDFQVKIRGFRIELGEIEARLAEHPAVREAVVLAREDTPGNKRLVAYYTVSLVNESERDTVGAEQFRAHLSASLPEYMVPAAYVRLESLPLTPNGKLDRKALPVPEALAYSARGYEPPKGEMEMKLASIWAEVLKVDRVGRHDDFFDLGGHSLLAVQLILRLQHIIPGEPLPLRAVLEAPTVERFAVWLDNHKEDEQEILVRVRPGTAERMPFFCVHGAGGNVLSMRPLAMALPPDLPVYFLQAKGLDGSAPFETVEETAQYYVDEIRKVQPHGPYQLGGGSYGGLVAFEMARVLEQLGEPVAALIMIDVMNPAFGRFMSKRERLSRHARFYTRRVAVHARKLLTLPPGEWLGYTRGRFKALSKYLRGTVGGVPAVKRKEFPADPDWEKIKSAAGTRLGEILERVGRASRIASIRYVPKPYNGAALLIQASDHFDTPYEDEYQGWKPVIRGAIEIFKVEGDHVTIFEDPAARPIAARIDAKFRESSVEVDLVSLRS
jgi:amino acid adenylation domain-containing protein